MESNLQIIYHFFDRLEGASKAPFHHANVSFYVGDEPEAVTANREMVKRQLGADFLLSAKQVHEDKIYSLKGPLAADTEVEGYDGLITNQPGIALMIQQADCQGVVLQDRVHKVIGAVHCGWRGSVINILEKCVKTMVDDFGADARRIQAAISPSLGPCCAEFVNHKLELPQNFSQFKVKENHFDFWQISISQLMDSGLQAEHISCASICTQCDENYFSYRRSVKKGLKTTGRHCSAIIQR